MKKYLLSSLALTFLAGFVSAQFASWSSSELILNNGVVQRIIQLPAQGEQFLTTTYKPVKGEFRYFTTHHPDFQFELGGTIYSGESSWQLADIHQHSDSFEGEGATVILRSKDGNAEVAIHFLMYPGLPLVRKNLSIKNIGETEVKLESVDVEKLSIPGYHQATFSWIYSDYGRRKSLGPYKGNMHDALVVVHHRDWKSGIVVGNEATGVLKHTSVYWDAPEIVAGLTHKEDRFPFRKWLKPGDSFKTPEVFTMIYNDAKEPGEILDTQLADYIRRHMGIRLSGLKEPPLFVYNNWHPFGKDINEALVLELADAAADAGVKEFIIDDGWQDNYGDWNIDTAKFPNGLKPVFDYIRSLGMKPGLWISIGSASSTSKVYREHPEWFVRDKTGNFGNVHSEGQDMITACFSTGWKDYIKDVLMKLALDYGLEYMKLDFAVVTSAYVFNPEKSGCYATDHPGHKDHHESLFINHERVWELFDELHAAKPSLFIDCTFEVMGGLQLIDYALLKHAEGDWLSNFQAPDHDGDLRIRNMSWWRSGAVPATALVVGNPRMDDKGWENHLKSQTGSLPIMLGDPRQLSAEDRSRYRHYAQWMQTMQSGYDIMNYRQDLPGFGEPAEGKWDGFSRINTETKAGGIIAIFRHGALENERLISVKHLDPKRMYDVKTTGGETIARMSGNDLETKGFKVRLDNIYSGELFEVSSK